MYEDLIKNLDIDNRGVLYEMEQLKKSWDYGDQIHGKVKKYFETGNVSELKGTVRITLRACKDDSNSIPPKPVTEKTTPASKMEYPDIDWGKWGSVKAPKAENIPPTPVPLAPPTPSPVTELEMRDSSKSGTTERIYPLSGSTQPVFPAQNTEKIAGKEETYAVQAHAS